MVVAPTNFKLLGRVLVLAAVAASAVASAHIGLEVYRGKPSLSVVLGLGVPVIVAALPLLAPSGGLAFALRAFAALLLFAGSVLSFSHFYLPAASFMLVAAVIAELDTDSAGTPSRGQD